MIFKGAIARLSFSRTRAHVSRRHCTAEAGMGEGGVLQCPVTLLTAIRHVSCLLAVPFQHTCASVVLCPCVRLLSLTGSPPGAGGGLDSCQAGV